MEWGQLLVNGRAGRERHRWAKPRKVENAKRAGASDGQFLSFFRSCLSSIGLGHTNLPDAKGVKG